MDNIYIAPHTKVLWSIAGWGGGYIPHICCVSYLWTMSICSRIHQLPLVWQLGKSSLEVHKNFFLEILLFKEHNGQSRKITCATFTLCHMKHVDGKIYTSIYPFLLYSWNVFHVHFMEVPNMLPSWFYSICFVPYDTWSVWVKWWTLLCVCCQLPNIVIS